MVLKVNMLSFKKTQVKTGNTINPAEDARNLADHADPVCITTYFHPYQNNTDVGTPNTTAENNALSFHHSDILCAFNWNQPSVCPTKNIANPITK